MTAQSPELLLYKGKECGMMSLPLDDYFVKSGARPDFLITDTANWHGYHGSWEIADDHLYLIGLCGTLRNGTEVTIETFFPGFPQRVFAHWYSGMLRIPEGEMVEYIHAGFASTFERDTFLDIEKGVVVGTRVRINTTPADS